jgi:hypothetical protein
MCVLQFWQYCYTAALFTNRINGQNTFLSGGAQMTVAGAFSSPLPACPNGAFGYNGCCGYKSHDEAAHPYKPGGIDMVRRSCNTMPIERRLDATAHSCSSLSVPLCCWCSSK